MEKKESKKEGIRGKIFSFSHLALHIVVLGDGEEKPAEDRPHWQEGNGSLRVRKLFRGNIYILQKLFSLYCPQKYIGWWSKYFLSSPGMVWTATASNRAKRVPSLLFVALPPSQVDLGSGHPLVLGDSHPFVILDSTLLPSSHSFCSLSLSPCQLQVVLILGPSVPSETVKT